MTNVIRDTVATEQKLSLGKLRLVVLDEGLMTAQTETINLSF